jgi:hypothetical protein
MNRTEVKFSGDMGVRNHLVAMAAWATSCDAPCISHLAWQPLIVAIRVDF